ncbi:MAG: protein-disulfide reductase DsbD [Aestuariibacter sp.]
MNRFVVVFGIFLCLLFGGAQARQIDQSLDDLFSNEPEFLPVEQAFIFEFSQQGDQLSLTFEIADGYYLYKKQFKTVVKDALLSEPDYPPSVEIEDEFFGVSEVFFEQVSIDYSIVQAKQDAVVKLRYQGCAEAGLCYPPTTKVIYLNAVAGEGTASASNTDINEAPQSQQFELQQLLSGEQSLLLSLALFLVLGVGLAFTPCVFPMYPIISGIVVGQGQQKSTATILSLSFIYVQGMAITYSLLGLIVASAGVKFQAALQHPAILGFFIIVFLALAVAMFGGYNMQLPASWQNKLNAISQKQKGGAYGGVFVMGAISGLIASPCTTAPLTGILLFIAQSGDLVLGFSALYALSLGMGIPLILFAVTGGKLLPKAGEWMNVVKVTFGFMMLIVALVFIERLVENLWTNLAWSVTGLAMFSYFYVMNQNSSITFWKGVRTLLIFLGLFFSALYGYQQVTQQSGVALPSTSTKAAHPEFLRIKDLTDFEAKLADANAQGKSVMIDLYADWCVACKEFEKYTFTDGEVQKALENTVWMQIDLTDNTPTNLEFQEYFSVLGLPTIMFFDEQGKELESARVTGFLNAEKFAAHVNRALNNN